MISKQLKYSSGYKFQLNSDVVVQTTLRPEQQCVIQGYVFLDTDGLLYIYRGYAWNGCTNAPDTDSNFLAGLVHDALYQLIQEGILEQSFKPYADMMLRDVMIECGSNIIVSEIFYLAVKWFGYLHMKPNKVRTLQIQ